VWPVIVTAAVVATAAAVLTALTPFPDPLPAAVWWSTAAVVLAIGLAVAAARRGGAIRRVGGALGVVVVLLAGVGQVNVHFGQFPTLRAALGLPQPGQVAFQAVASAEPLTVSRPPGGALSSAWRPPSGMPAIGAVSEVVIDPTQSRFPARPAWLYLPPAYLTAPRARLPVLVLVSGQPGSPHDWLEGGRLAAVMNRFAAAHAGLAPVDIMPDALGTSFANPLCLDSRLGRAATYLAVDVPAWARTHLQVDADPRTWAVGGLSAGGTCALQLATTKPEVYPTFVDISGQSEPSLGDRARTVAAAFGGDMAAFTAANPLDLLAKHRYPGSAGVVAVGNADTVYRPQDQLVAGAARRAGMQIVFRELPGGHDWCVWSAGLETSLPWLAGRLGLVP
jgi:S-formylglutathione hydrolase FrmB